MAVVNEVALDWDWTCEQRRLSMTRMRMWMTMAFY